MTWGNDGWWYKNKEPFKPIPPRPAEEGAATPVVIPYNDVSFRLENYTEFIARRITISAQKIPRSVNPYTPPCCEMMVAAKDGSTTVTTTKNVASTNGLYDLTIDFIRPEDKDKPDADTETGVFYSIELANLGTLALFFEKGQFRGVANPKGAP